MQENGLKIFRTIVSKDSSCSGLGKTPIKKTSPVSVVFFEFIGFLGWGFQFESC